MDIPVIEPGVIPPDHVAPDALQGIRRQQTNPKRWDGAGWAEFAEILRSAGIDVIEQAIDAGRVGNVLGRTPRLAHAGECNLRSRFGIAF